MNLLTLGFQTDNLVLFLARYFPGPQKHTESKPPVFHLSFGIRLEDAKKALHGHHLAFFLQGL